MTTTQLQLFPVEPRIAEDASDYLNDLAEREERSWCAYLGCDEPVTGTTSAMNGQLTVPVCHRHQRQP